jgi:hypothetical protein
MAQLNFPISEALKADLITFQGAILQAAVRSRQPVTVTQPMSVTMRALLPVLLRYALDTLKPADMVALLQSAQSHSVAPSEQPKKPPRAERVKLWDEK